MRGLLRKADLVVYGLGLRDGSDRVGISRVRS